MCGIVGWIDWEENIEDKYSILDSMVQTLSNRGPDASGVWLSNVAGFAHRRLSVIDPQNGAQPMIRCKGENTYVITYNGELYNSYELRKALELKGYTFSTNCDTEVLLLSFIEWGYQCVDHLNGIYAFGIWDQFNQTLFLARDRFGVKPLFYIRRNNSLLFASELKALLAHPNISAQIDNEGLAEIFALGPSRTPGNGVFCGINEVKPGHYLIYNKDGFRIIKYWDLESRPHEDDLDTTISKVRDLIISAIERQLVSDVPLCTFLSGGIDSSAITSIATNYYKNNGLGTLNTFSVDYLDNGLYFKPNEFQPNSDNHWIDLVSSYSGTNHHNVTLGITELADTLIDAVKARDLPGMVDIDSSLYLFCKEIKKEFTVSLSGECADEIFGGYPWFNDSSLSINTFPWLRYLDKKLELFSPQLIEKISPIEYVGDRYSDTLHQVPKLIGESYEDARRREIFYLNIQWFMATLLDRKDRMSMACGLEVRVPFCDHNIVEYVWNIPWKMKRIDGMEKGIMRKALHGILPSEVLNRKKSPYPKTHNPSYTNAVSTWLSHILEDKQSPILPLINVDKVKELIESKGNSFTKPWFGQLMTGPQLMAYLIQLDAWFRLNRVTIK